MSMTNSLSQDSKDRISKTLFVDADGKDQFQFEISELENQKTSIEDFSVNSINKDRLYNEIGNNYFKLIEDYWVLIRSIFHTTIVQSMHNDGSIVFPTDPNIHISKKDTIPSEINSIDISKINNQEISDYLSLLQSEDSNINFNAFWFPYNFFNGTSYQENQETTPFKNAYFANDYEAVFEYEVIDTNTDSPSIVYTEISFGALIQTAKKIKYDLVFTPTAPITQQQVIDDLLVEIKDKITSQMISDICNKITEISTSLSEDNLTELYSHLEPIYAFFLNFDKDELDPDYNQILDDVASFYQITLTDLSFFLDEFYQFLEKRISPEGTIFELIGNLQESQNISDKIQKIEKMKTTITTYFPV